MDVTPRVVVVAFLVGALVGAGAVAFVTPADRTVSPTSSYTAATGCLAPDERAPASWIVRVPGGDQTTFAFNRTFTHEPASVRLNASVESPSEGDYVYRLAVEPDPDADQKTVPDDCTPRTTLDAVVSVPSDYRTFSVVFDGRELVTIENDGSGPLYRTLERGNETARVGRAA